MKQKIIKYRGETNVVSYDVKRCIHAGNCVASLPEVFNVESKPWINPDAAERSRLAESIRTCPSGALRLLTPEGEPEEENYPENTVTIGADGPLYVRGALQILAETDEVVADENRVALCRCGKSKNKPYCDNSHEGVFVDAGALGTSKVYDVEDPTAGLKIKPTKNGSLFFDGPMHLQAASDSDSVNTSRAYLCRCGGSSNKPYCDGSHRKVEFDSSS